MIRRLRRSCTRNYPWKPPSAICSATGRASLPAAPRGQGGSATRQASTRLGVLSLEGFPASAQHVAFARRAVYGIRQLRELWRLARGSGGEPLPQNSHVQAPGARRVLAVAIQGDGEARPGLVICRSSWPGATRSWRFDRCGRSPDSTLGTGAGRFSAAALQPARRVCDSTSGVQTKRRRPES